MKHEMGVGVNVYIAAECTLYDVFLYGLHFNFASCVYCVYCYAAEAQCGQNGNAHDSQRRYSFIFRARTIAYIS